MASLNNILAYVHNSRPPYERLAGPIYPNSADLEIGHSVQSNANMNISATDLTEAWIRPGVCWVLESLLGDDPWGGFVEEESLSFKPTTVSISLIGPKQALLEIEYGVRLPVPVTRGFAIKQILEVAQSLNIGVFPGIIEQEGAAVAIDVRGETLSGFIDSVKEAAAVDWRERTLLNKEHNTVQFYIDFGILKKETDLVIENQDIVDGHNEFTKKRAVSSLTVLGEAGSFADRNANVTGDRSRLGATASEGVVPSDSELLDNLRQRDFGPAASRHRIEINERFGKGSVAEYISNRHAELLRSVDQITLTLDGTRTTGRSIKLGDVVRLNIIDWGLGMNLDTKIHIVEIRPSPATGSKEVVANIIPDSGT